MPLDLSALKASLGRWQDGLADVGWNSLYWCNHDQPRIVSRLGDDDGYRVEAATMLATVLHLHRGTPYIYQGEEIGMTNTPIASLDDFLDIESMNRYAATARPAIDPVRSSPRAGMGRDNARTPMQWDTSAHGGFTTGTPWMPSNPNYVDINAAAAVADPASVWHHYRRLIELRHNEPAWCTATSRCCCPTTERSTRSPAASVDRAARVGELLREPVVADVPDAAEWARAVVELGHAPDRPS